MSAMEKAPKPKKPETTVIGFRAEQGLKEAIEAAAKKDQRSVSQWITIKLRAALGRK